MLSAVVSLETNNFVSCSSCCHPPGKVCTDGSECEGMCVVDETNLGPNNRPEVGSAATGVCIADDNPCGCWFEISNGEIQHGLCAD